MVSSGVIVVFSRPSALFPLHVLYRLFPPSRCRVVNPRYAGVETADSPEHDTELHIGQGLRKPALGGRVGGVDNAVSSSHVHTLLSRSGPLAVVPGHRMGPAPAGAVGLAGRVRVLTRLALPAAP